jgi:hypothetical protein
MVYSHIALSLSNSRLIASILAAFLPFLSPATEAMFRLLLRDLS